MRKFTELEAEYFGYEMIIPKCDGGTDYDRCWLWAGPVHTISGFGTYFIHGVTHQAHRLGYWLATGVEPAPRMVHTCGNKLCCNWKHLAVSTSAEDTFDRFWSRVDVRLEDECWLWLGKIDQKGYGRVKVDGKSTLVSRAAYVLSHGEISRKDRVTTTCQRKNCCNPTHVRLGV